MEDEWWIDYSRWPEPPPSLSWSDPDADPTGDIATALSDATKSLTLLAVGATVNGVAIMGFGRTLTEAQEDLNSKIKARTDELKEAFASFGGHVLRLQPIVDEIEEIVNPKPKQSRDKGRPNNNTGPRPERQFGYNGRKKY